MDHVTICNSLDDNGYYLAIAIGDRHRNLDAQICFFRRDQRSNGSFDLGRFYQFCHVGSSNCTPRGGD